MYPGQENWVVSQRVNPWSAPKDQTGLAAMQHQLSNAAQQESANASHAYGVERRAGVERLAAINAGCCPLRSAAEIFAVGVRPPSGGNTQPYIPAVIVATAFVGDEFD
jgi:hypothetical protein